MGAPVARRMVGDVNATSWCADRRLTVVKFLLAALFAVVPWVISTNATGGVLGLIVAAGMSVWALRDVVAPVRLTADADGLTVISGFAGHRRLSWSDIERVRLDERSRYGARSRLLEIDTGEALFFLSRYDLGVEPADALDIISALRVDPA
jgi:hypothetical protein